MNEKIDLNTLELIEENAFGYVSDEDMAAIIEEYEEELNISLINDYIEISNRVSSSTLTEDEEVFIYDLYAEGYLESEVYAALIENGNVNADRADMLLKEDETFNNTEGDELSALVYRFAVIKAL